MGFDKRGGWSTKDEGMAECSNGNGQHTQAKAKAKSCPHPVLRAGIFGRIEYVHSTLTVLDNLAPMYTGRYLPDLPYGWEPPDVSEAREAYLSAGRAS